MKISFKIFGCVSFVVCVVSLHIGLKDSYDADEVKSYFRNAKCIEVWRENGTCTEYSIATNSAARDTYLGLVQKSRFHTLRKARKETLLTSLMLRLEDGSEKQIDVCCFPCVLVDGYIVMVSAPLYFRLKEGVLL